MARRIRNGMGLREPKFVVFDRFEPDTGIVHLHMRGACAGCPSSTYTLKQGIENMLKAYVPEVTAVEAVL